MQLLLQLGQRLQGRLVLLLGQLPQLRVGHHLLRLGLGVQGAPVGAEDLHQGLELRLFLVQLGHQLRVVVRLRRPQPGLDLTVFRLNGVQLVQHGQPSFSLVPARRRKSLPL